MVRSAISNTGLGRKFVSVFKNEDFYIFHCKSAIYCIIQLLQYNSFIINIYMIYILYIHLNATFLAIAIKIYSCTECFLVGELIKKGG